MSEEEYARLGLIIFMSIGVIYLAWRFTGLRNSRMTTAAFLAENKWPPPEEVPQHNVNEFGLPLIDDDDFPPMPECKSPLQEMTITGGPISADGIEKIIKDSIDGCRRIEIDAAINFIARHCADARQLEVDEIKDRCLIHRKRTR